MTLSLPLPYIDTDNPVAVGVTELATVAVAFLDTALPIFEDPDLVCTVRVTVAVVDDVIRVNILFTCVDVRLKLVGAP
jgi:hypothetical protein